jgi:hypothetical protein
MPGRFMPQVSRHDFLDSRLRGPESVVIAGLNEKPSRKSSVTN